jgi:hypothetical protein
MSATKSTIRPLLEQLEQRDLMAVAAGPGAVLHNVQLEDLYLGSNWATSSGYGWAAKQEGFTSYLVQSPFMDALYWQGYGVGRGQAYQGRILPYQINHNYLLPDSSIQWAIQQAIYNGGARQPDQNSLYCVYVEPGVGVVNPAGQTSLNVNDGSQHFLGYHYWFWGHDAWGRWAVIPYAVLPSPGWPNYSSLGFPSDFGELTSTASHEIAEAVTDPTLNTWKDWSTGEEIGDITSNYNQYLNGYYVQLISDMYGRPMPVSNSPIYSPQDWVSPSNLSTFTSTVNDGTINSGVVQSISGQVTAELPVEPNRLRGVATALSHSAEAYRRFITGAYQKYLGRSPDAAGLADWLTAMQHGLSDEQLEAFFIGSQEYIQDHGGAGAGWVAGMYQDLLGRTASSDEVAGWVRNLQSGMSPQQVAYFFAHSAEREGQRVQADYQQFLGRQATADEVNLWVNAFEHGTSNEDVVAGFVGSVENFHNHGDNRAQWLAGAYWDLLGRTPSDAEIQTWLPAL